ncbi:MAG: polysaccharide pyruvyl transferase family protein, partial [Tannerellaceae bacterium]|nr:polysaccharide pyruvyl transferase family protein [Tannerellaceae bacterium]
QIWSESLIGYNKICFLEWVDTKIPRIAYAPSFGSPSVSVHFLSKIKQSLPKFQVVTVRETSGVEICEQAGVTNALCVPDPTLLLTQYDYSLLFSDIGKEKYKLPQKYLLLYSIGDFFKTDIVNEIKQFARQNNLAIVYIPIGGEQNDIIDENCWKMYPSIQEWLFLMTNADYVLTNSFHGSIFSIIFNKQFGVYLAEGEASKKNDRIHSLLNSLNLNKRIITAGLQELNKSIAYEPINAYLQKQREEIQDKFMHWFN